MIDNTGKNLEFFNKLKIQLISEGLFDYVTMKHKQQWANETWARISEPNYQYDYQSEVALFKDFINQYGYSKLKDRVLLVEVSKETEVEQLVNEVIGYLENR